MAQLPYIGTTAVAQGGPYGSASSVIELGPVSARNSPRFVANTGTLVEKSSPKSGELLWLMVLRGASGLSGLP
jgi:hypothetical protein